MHIHIVQHEVFEAPGAIYTWAVRHGHTVTFSKVYEYEALPNTISDIDLLVVMGGPQSPNTTLAECPHFDAKAEIRLIKSAIEADKLVIGVCLGAQLIGEALGAKVEHSPEKEIGVLTMNMTAEGMADRLTAQFGSQLAVGHWHSDMPGLTADSAILAYTEGCPRQIVRYKPKVYGFQCHMEFEPALVEMLIAEEIEFLETNTTHRFVHKPAQIRQVDFIEMNEALFGFLDKFSRL